MPIKKRKWQNAQEIKRKYWHKKEKDGEKVVQTDRIVLKIRQFFYAE